jgi:hypothetical protein
MENGSQYEVEIRCASIYIVEKVKEKLNVELKSRPELQTTIINSVHLDKFLWNYRRKSAKQLEYIPFHKTFSVFY